MRVDKFGQCIFSENDLCDIFLTDPTKKLTNTLVDQDINFDQSMLEYAPKLKKYVEESLSVEQFDEINQNNWYLPNEYKNLDIAKYVLDLCKTDEELQRAGQELLLFQEKNMFILLKYLKYLVDTMREHNIVWGVGRGSSVASFVLFLIGVHKINSLYYDLSIDEFIK